MRISLSPPAPAHRLCLVLVLLLSGCTTLTVPGLFAAANLSPLTSDPAEIGAAVSVPAGVGLRPGDARLFLGFEPTTPGARALAENFDLAVRPLRRLDGADPMDAVFAAEIAPADHDRFRSAQTSIRRLRASGDDGVGTLSISVSAGCFIGEAPTKLPVATWLRTRRDGDYVRLTRRRDLLALAGEPAEALRDALVPCEQSS